MIYWQFRTLKAIGVIAHHGFTKFLRHLGLANAIA